MKLLALLFLVGSVCFGLAAARIEGSYSWPLVLANLQGCIGAMAGWAWAGRER